MNKAEIAKAVAQAGDLSVSLLDVDQSNLYGCALPTFKPTFATITQVAALIRWQAMYFNGTWDAVELDNVCYLMSKKVTIIGE